MPILTIRVFEQNITSKGISNVLVYLFRNGGPIEDPGQATMSGNTDSVGEVRFEVLSGAFRVGIAAPGYEAASPYDAVPEAWKDTWSAWGAVGIGEEEDETYEFPLIFTGALPECPFKRLDGEERPFLCRLWRKWRLRREQR